MSEKENNIVFVTDDFYVKPLVVTITSIKKNIKGNDIYNIHILGNNLSEKNKEIIEKCSNNNIKINIIDANDYLKKLKNITCSNRHVNSTGLLKFYIPEIFKTLDKILYLDSDILVLKDIKELINVRLNGYYLAAVKDPYPIIIKKEYLKTLGIENQKYFNSGVMLLNLEKMRNDNIIEKLVDYRLNNQTTFMDQDTLNVILGEKCLMLHCKYNVLYSYMEYWVSHLHEVYNELTRHINEKSIIHNAVILHFTDSKKPWIYNIGEMSNLYKKYWDISPIEEDFPKKVDMKIYKISNYKKLKLLINLIFG